jgi:ribonuclease HII
MELSRVPLGELRKRIRNAGSDQQAMRIADALREDRRRGAREIAEAHDRRVRARGVEASRVDALFARRRALLARGARLVAGVDEVGMGPLAGPVVAAAVVLPETVDLPGLNDSKRLSRKARERIAAAIREQSIAIGIGEVDAAEIDRMNIFRAGLEAMRRAAVSLGVRPDHVMVDARTIPNLGIAQTALVGGDAIDGSIAAASIVAKVYRDALMRGMEARHPGYGFDRHMGYGTDLHLERLRRLGPSPIHRRSFAPVSAQMRG